jgi:hypothetical protein
VTKAIRVEGAQVKPAQRRALDALKDGEAVDLTRARYEQLNGVSRSQAAYDLAELVDAGILVRLGAGRSTRYRLAQAQGARRRWTTDRIRAELVTFCSGRTTWPSAGEFKRAGRSDLYVAASRYGGIGHWADELGLSRRGEAAAEGGRRRLPFRRPQLRRLLLGQSALAIVAALLLTAAGAGTAVVVLRSGDPPHAGARPAQASPRLGHLAAPFGDDLRTLRLAAVAARSTQAEAVRAATASASRAALVLRARRGDSWISARTPSGTLVYEGIVNRGRQLRLEGRTLQVRLGAASALDASVGGAPARPLPARAAVIVASPHGIRVVEWTPESPARALLASQVASQAPPSRATPVTPPAPPTTRAPTSSWPAPLPASSSPAGPTPLPSP